MTTNSTTRSVRKTSKHTHWDISWSIDNFCGIGLVNYYANNNGGQIICISEWQNNRQDLFA